jgi:hypothetical protein
MAYIKKQVRGCLPHDVLIAVLLSRTMHRATLNCFFALRIQRCKYLPHPPLSPNSKADWPLDSWHR